MEGALISLLGVALAASVISTAIGVILLIRLAMVKHGMRKIQKRMLDKGIDTTDINL